MHPSRVLLQRLRAMPDLSFVAWEIADLRRRPVTRRRTFGFSETPDGTRFFWTSW
jgi:hypothetical protein